MRFGGLLMILIAVGLHGVHIVAVGVVARRGERRACKREQNCGPSGQSGEGFHDLFSFNVSGRQKSTRAILPNGW